MLDYRAVGDDKITSKKWCQGVTLYLLNTPDSFSLSCPLYGLFCVFLDESIKAMCATLICCQAENQCSWFAQVKAKATRLCWNWKRQHHDIMTVRVVMWPDGSHLIMRKVTICHGVVCTGPIILTEDAFCPRHLWSFMNPSRTTH